MAIIQCPECEKSVSDQATACPHCGFPLGKQNKFSVIIKEGDENNKELINYIQDVKKINFSEAEELLLNIPFTLVSDVIDDVAKKYYDEAIKLGATAEILEKGEKNAPNLHKNKYYSIRLISAEYSSRDLILFLQHITGKKMPVIRKYIDDAPSIIANNLSYEVAKRYCYSIINYGGFAEIVEQSSYNNQEDLSIKGNVRNFTKPSSCLGCLGCILLYLFIHLLIFIYHLAK